MGPGRSGRAYSRVCGAATAKGSEHVRVMRRQDPRLSDPKELFGVLRRDVFDFLHADSMQFRDLLGNLPDVGGFVTLAAMGSRRKVWSVGLDDNAIQRHVLRDAAEH